MPQSRYRRDAHLKSPHGHVTTALMPRVSGGGNSRQRSTPPLEPGPTVESLYLLGDVVGVGVRASLDGVTEPVNQDQVGNPTLQERVIRSTVQDFPDGTWPGRLANDRGAPVACSTPLAETTRAVRASVGTFNNRIVHYWVTVRGTIDADRLAASIRAVAAAPTAATAIGPTRAQRSAIGPGRPQGIWSLQCVEGRLAGHDVSHFDFWERRGFVFARDCQRTELRFIPD